MGLWQITPKMRTARIQIPNIIFVLIYVHLMFVKHGTCNSLKKQIDIAEGLPAETTIVSISTIFTHTSSPYEYFYTEGVGIETDLELNTTGVIKTKVKLDRETRDLYKIIAISAESTTAEITIHVTDTNDNSPTFAKDVIKKSLPETTPQDVKIHLGSAIDPDLGNYTTQRYEIVSGNTNNDFRLSSKRGRNGVLFLDLEINGELDYEETRHYDLEIRAYDGGVPPRYGTLKVEISIIDTNDNQPIFNQSRYYTTVKENATVGSTVLQVFATDRDSGDNGKISYKIDRQRSDPEEKFDVNPTSGVVFVNGQLDYETKQNYELIVIAADNGTQKLQTTAIVSVKVEDVNDNSPEIHIKFFGNGSGEISEYARPNDYIASISVSDPDVKDYDANVNVTIHGGDGHFGLVTSNNVVFLVILSLPLDREKTPIFTLTVIATDSGSPPLVTTKSITLKVLDENDNPPVFSNQIYYADIQEVVPSGSSVYQVTATDLDEGRNAQISYTIFHTPETHSDWFQIDNQTGLITTKSKLDCETAAEPRLLVGAKDNGDPPLSANATVVVRIMDVNDNPPVFHQSFYNATVPENVALQKCILEVAATDPDCGVNAKVSYSIATNMGFQYPSEFEIKQDSGKVCVIKSLDYEQTKVYEFPALAQDQNGLKTTAMIKITVEDVNDNRPVFYPVHYTVNLNQGSATGKEVVVVRATDKDTGKWGAVQYQIVSGNAQDIFIIDAQSGVVKLKKAVSSQGVYTLMVKATDGGGLTSSVNANITVSIVSSSDRPATFSETLYKWSVKESEALYYKVGTVSATSPDGKSVTYSIVSGDHMGYFSIGSTSGEIRINKALDADTQAFVLLSVRAQVGTPPSYGSAQVNITILDVNDNSPQFTRSFVNIPIKEDTSLSEVIYVVQATDKDSGLNGKVRYSVTEGQSTFQVDTLGGQLKLRNKLDYEVKKNYTLKVMAFDLGKPSRNSILSIMINVKDVNDNKPQFNQSTYIMNIFESIAINTKFGQVYATDKDSGNNALITYRLSDSANMDTFGIFSDSGSIYNKVKLDREKHGKYTFAVLAFDNGIPSKTATATVSINVMDTNDNSPEFHSKSYMFYLEEEQPRLTYVGNVTAYDPDNLDSEHLRYSVVSQNNGNPYFRINQVSGVIETMLTIDREVEDTYQFEVQVTDGGTPPRKSSILVRVRILDINDNAPVFQHHGPYQVSVKENEPRGTTVIQVLANDKDKGENKTITYAIVNGGSNTDGKKFNINPQTGLITTNQVFNHENKNRYIFNVAAIDGGKPQKRDTKTVEVTITDINESPPVFDTKSVSMSVKENTPPGTIVGSVKARDKDSGENGRVNYYIVSGNLFGTFGVNHSTGQIFIASQVDYEMSSQYLIKIRAIDNSNINPMSSVINVNISVVDLNDNVPKFEEDPITFTIEENTPKGHHVWTFTATDRDSLKNGNGRVHYEIITQSAGVAWFEIEKTSGVLKTLREIDFEEISFISITIKATDQPLLVEDHLSSTVTALIMIKDLNDNWPVFQSNANVHVLEDEPVGYPVVYVIATDKDSKQNGHVTYSMVSGNEDGHFKLDSQTGRLMIVKTLDREIRSFYSLNVSATDHGYPRRSSYQTLSIRVEDVNDNPPVFDHSVYTANITENGQVGELVTRIHATDKDTGDNGKVSYIIPYGIADNKFLVNNVSGEIRTNASLNREEHDSLIITAYASDGSFPALYDTTTILINVLDANDNSPVFKNPKYFLDVPENAKFSIIHTVHAMDADIGKNGDITYSIIGGNTDNKFLINSTTGAISCTPLDRETRASYTLEIEARDNGSPPKKKKVPTATLR